MEAVMVRSEGGVRTRLMATLSYLGILCLVPLVMNQNNEYVYFHARQGLIIWIWSVIAVLALYVPGVGPWFSGVSALAVVVLSAIGLVAVFLNKAWRLPLVHSIAARM